MERIILINGRDVKPKQSKIQIADILRSDTAQMDKLYHGAFLDSFKEDEDGNGITVHFRYDYKTETLAAL